MEGEDETHPTCKRILRNVDELIVKLKEKHDKNFKIDKDFKELSIKVNKGISDACEECKQLFLNTPRVSPDEPSNDECHASNCLSDIIERLIVDDGALIIYLHSSMNNSVFPLLYMVVESLLPFFGVEDCESWLCICKNRNVAKVGSESHDLENILRILRKKVNEENVSTAIMNHQPQSLSHIPEQFQMTSQVPSENSFGEKAPNQRASVEPVIENFDLVNDSSSERVVEDRKDTKQKKNKKSKTIEKVDRKSKMPISSSTTTSSLAQPLSSSAEPKRKRTRNVISSPGSAFSSTYGSLSPPQASSNIHRPVLSNTPPAPQHFNTSNQPQGTGVVLPSKKPYQAKTIKKATVPPQSKKQSMISKKPVLPSHSPKQAVVKQGRSVRTTPNKAAFAATKTKTKEVSKKDKPRKPKCTRCNDKKFVMCGPKHGGIVAKKNDFVIVEGSMSDDGKELEIWYGIVDSITSNNVRVYYAQRFHVLKDDILDDANPRERAKIKSFLQKKKYCDNQIIAWSFYPGPLEEFPKVVNHGVVCGKCCKIERRAFSYRERPQPNTPPGEIFFVNLKRSDLREIEALVKKG